MWAKVDTSLITTCVFPTLAQEFGNVGGGATPVRHASGNFVWGVQISDPPVRPEIDAYEGCTINALVENKEQNQNVEADDTVKDGGNIMLFWHGFNPSRRYSRHSSTATLRTVVVALKLCDGIDGFGCSLGSHKSRAYCFPSVYRAISLKFLVACGVHVGLCRLVCAAWFFQWLILA